MIKAWRTKVRRFPLAVRIERGTLLNMIKRIAGIAGIRQRRTRLQNAVKRYAKRIIPFAEHRAFQIRPHP
ncbi:hypothetical protein D3C78_1097820 [compost metagenome]